MFEITKRRILGMVNLEFRKKIEILVVSWLAVWIVMCSNLIPLRLACDLRKKKNAHTHNMVIKLPIPMWSTTLLFEFSTDHFHHWNRTTPYYYYYLNALKSINSFRVQPILLFLNSKEKRKKKKGLWECQQEWILSFVYPSFSFSSTEEEACKSP